MTLPTDDFEKTIFPENRAWIDNVGPQSPDDCPTLYQTLGRAVFAEPAGVLFCQLCRSDGDEKAHYHDRSWVCANHLLEGGTLFEPLDPEDALRKILELRADTNLHQRLVEDGQARAAGDLVRHEERAEAYLALCQELLTSNRLPYE